MTSAKEQVWLGVLQRMTAVTVGIHQLASINTKLDALVWELGDVIAGLVASQPDDCAAEEDVRHFMLSAVHCGAFSEQERAALEQVLNLLFQRVMAQTWCEDQAARCRGPRLDPGGGPMSPDDRDLDDPW